LVANSIRETSNYTIHIFLQHLIQLSTRLIYTNHDIYTNSNLVTVTLTFTIAKDMNIYEKFNGNMKFGIVP
jgi:hypothetical protein